MWLASLATELRGSGHVTHTCSIVLGQLAKETELNVHFCISLQSGMLVRAGASFAVYCECLFKGSCRVIAKQWVNLAAC